VQRRVGIEEVDQELTGQQSVDRHTPLDIILKACFPLQDDQRPIAVTRQLRRRFHQLVDGPPGGIVRAGEQLGQQ
jgi:hypothetical protein